MTAFGGDEPVTWGRPLDDLELDDATRAELDACWAVLCAAPPQAVAERHITAAAAWAAEWEVDPHRTLTGRSLVRAAVISATAFVATTGLAAADVLPPAAAHVLENVVETVRVAVNPLPGELSAPPPMAPAKASAEVGAATPKVTTRPATAPMNDPATTIPEPPASTAPSSTTVTTVVTSTTTVVTVVTTTVPDDGTATSAGASGSSTTTSTTVPDDGTATSAGTSGSSTTTTTTSTTEPSTTTTAPSTTTTTAPPPAP